VIDGADDDDDGAPPPASIIPFPKLRPNDRLRIRWLAEVKRANEQKQKRYQMISPLDAVPSLMRKREMQPMCWPAEWPEFARRCRHYVGEGLSITAAIGAGKTSFAVQLANANAAAGFPVIWAPLELDPEQLDLRLVANLHGAPMTEVREQWSEENIRHTLAAVDDMWHFVDVFDDPDAQFAAIEDAIEIAWKVYQMPPVVIVDHMGELIAEEKDATAALRRWSFRFRKLWLRTNSFGVLLNQVSKSNQGATTGKVDFDSAADALGIEIGSQAVASAVTNALVLVAYKTDDSPALDGQCLIAKARNTGLEGRIGLRFRKSGGRWTELDYLPATPTQIKAEVDKAARDKHRSGPPPSQQQARQELNASREGDAAVSRRHYILQAITRHGALGMELADIRRVHGVGKGAALLQALQELERAGALERYQGRWRIIAR